MNLGVFSINTVLDLAKTRDAPGQQAFFLIFFSGHESGPVVAFPMALVGTGTGDASRLSNVKEEDAARGQGTENALEHSDAALLRVALIEEIVETLADRRDRDARRQVRREQRANAKLRPGHSRPGQSDHSRREVDAESVVTGGAELLCEDTTAASQVDHQASMQAVPLQCLQKHYSGIAGGVAETRI